ncbi:MAG: DUF86 domain-containing protein [Geminicoccaceae bacterium]
MDALLLRKAASLERCIARVKGKYIGHEVEFDGDLDLQDVIVLNLQRACQLAIDMALRIGRTRRLALPADTAEMFKILAQAGLIDRALGDSLKRMVGFRNIAVHEYQELDLAKVRAIIEHRLDDLRAFSTAMIAADPSA